MTIREFAKLCGVSPATVSRYFSGGAGLSPAAAEKIQKQAEALGYRPASRSRKARTDSRVFAVFTPVWRHCFFNDLLAHLVRLAASQGFQMMVFPSAVSDPSVYVPLLRALSPMGALLFDELPDDPLAEILHQEHIPSVMCAALSLNRYFPSVHVDDMAAAYDGANYLMRLGHKNIALISAKPQTISSGFQRIMGCRKAMEDAGLVLPDSHIVYSGSSFQDGYQGMNQLFDRELPISAVFTFSDDMAAGALISIQEHGYSVPDDISVLAFDNCTVSEETRPKLTTLSQPIDLIAARSLELLCDYPETPESITLRHSLVERDSCAAHTAPNRLEVLYESSAGYPSISDAHRRSAGSGTD